MGEIGIFDMTWCAVERDTQSSYLAVLFDRPNLLETSENELSTKKIRDERRRSMENGGTK